MLIGAGMLIVPTLLKWRAIFAPLRAAFGYFRPRPRPFDMEIWDDEAAGDPEMVRRAAAILEAYLGKSSLVALGDGRRGAPHEAERVLSRQEALEVLGLESGRRRGGDPRRPQAPARARPSRPQRLGLSRPEGPAGTGYASGAGARVAASGETDAPRNRAAKR